MAEEVSLSRMLAQSVIVLTKPGPDSFRRFQSEGGVRAGLRYFVVAAAIASAVGFLGGMHAGFLPALRGLAVGLAGSVLVFTALAWLIFYLGETQGGTASFGEVLYSLALFAAPLHALAGVILTVPSLVCVATPTAIAAAVYSVYLAYVAARAVMSLEKSRALITVAFALVAVLVWAGIAAFAVGTAATMLRL